MSATATNLRAVGEPPGGADRRPQPARPAIRISDLQKSFGTLVAIDHVSVDIEPGEFFVIVGPSGCGKTTLLRILAGLETATAGTIEIDTPAGSDRPENSMVFQGESIFPWMTVWNNAAYGLRMRNAPAAIIKERVGHYLDAHRADALRRLLSAPALRRHEAARLDRARLRQRSGNPADGRAVLGARRAEQAAAAGGAAAHLGRAQEDRGVHHPQRRRGGAFSATASW